MIFPNFIGWLFYLIASQFSTLLLAFLTSCPYIAKLLSSTLAPLQMLFTSFTTPAKPDPSCVVNTLTALPSQFNLSSCKRCKKHL